MDRIFITNDDLNQLLKVDVGEHCESVLYEYQNKILKLYNLCTETQKISGLPFQDLNFELGYPDRKNYSDIKRMKSIERAILSLEENQLKGLAVFPTAIAYSENYFPIGFLMNNYCSSINFNQIDSLETKIKVLKVASQKLREIHKNNIILSDIQQGNILLTPDNDVLFCDVLSGKINNILIKKLYSNFGQVEAESPIFAREYESQCSYCFLPYILKQNRNKDIISLTLMLLGIIVPEEIRWFRSEKYYQYIKSLDISRNLANYLLNITRISQLFSKCPYPDEYVDELISAYQKTI